MLKSLSRPLTSGAAEFTDNFVSASHENYFSHRTGIWQMWTVIMAFTAMLLAAAILTMV